MGGRVGGWVSGKVSGWMGEWESEWVGGWEGGEWAGRKVLGGGGRGRSQDYENAVMDCQLDSDKLHGLGGGRGGGGVGQKS